MYVTEEAAEKVVLVGLELPKADFDVERCLDELEELAETAGAVVVGRIVQKRDAPHRSFYVGKGKLEEIKSYVDEVGATGIICDDELSPMQIKNLENALDTKVMNRTLLILDIFASRASSAEGKVQVELAQLKYNLSHLTGKGIAMSRLGGGIGTRGPGEKKLETDRRIIADRISSLKAELDEIKKHREILRQKRVAGPVPVVALVGYTNAGKSTLMNTITGANVLAENKLFATLDTTTRRVEFASGIEYLFVDTVGFIQKLPHGLIQAFRATLEEVKYADILVHVVDASNPAREEQMEVVYKTLDLLDCGDKPIVTVFNKLDLPDVERPLPADTRARECQMISAKTGKGIEYLAEAIEDIIRQFKKSMRVLIPYDAGAMVSYIYSSCEIITSEHREDGIYFELYATEEIEKRLSSYEI